jgi:hypothetical protein
MRRERAIKIVLVLVGLLFSAGIYPLTMSLWKMNKSDYGDDMMLSLYFALGIFLLMAVRNPSASRSLIAFAAWSSFAHGAVMAVLAVHFAGDRCSPDRAGPGKALRRAGIGGHCVGSHSKSAMHA